MRSGVERMKTSKPAIPRPLPRIARFERLAYGLFLHWGLYSQLGEGEWTLQRNGPARPIYNKLATTFTAEDFDARAWARLAKAAGMTYITLTTRHHEGFSLYDTRGLSKFDAPHSAAKRDLVAEFVAACRAEGLVPFFYHTTIDWQWWKNLQWPAVPLADGGPQFGEYLDYLHASVEVLCRHYGPVGGFWFDGNWAHPKADWKEDRLYALIRRHQPEALIINNTGLGAEGVRGHPELDSTTFEQGVAERPDRRGWKKYVAAEMCHTFNSHWGTAARDFNYLSPAQLIQNLCLARRAGANYLHNVGPLAQGGIPEYEGAALRKAGGWVELHRDILHAGRPVDGVRCTGRDFVLQAGRKYYYFAFDLPLHGTEQLPMSAGRPNARAIDGLTARIRSVRWLDNGEPLAFTQHPKQPLLALRGTSYRYGTDLVVRVAELA